MSSSCLSLKAALPAAALVALVACGGGGNPAAESIPSAGASVPAALAGTWLLESLAPTGQASVRPPAADRFTATFEADGRLHLQADCNRCASSFAAGAASLEVSPMACTRAYCPSAPLDTDFAMLVGGASAWSIEGGRLSLRSPAGVVLLRR